MSRQVSDTSLTVSQATPTVTWSNPAAITYGTALSGTQSDATASGVGGISLPGTFVYTPAAGTVLSAGANQTLSVTFTPTDTADYNQANKTVSINDNEIMVTAMSGPTPVSLTLAVRVLSYVGQPGESANDGHRNHYDDEPHEPRPQPTERLDLDVGDVHPRPAAIAREWQYAQTAEALGWDWDRAATDDRFRRMRWFTGGTKHDQCSTEHAYGHLPRHDYGVSGRSDPEYGDLQPDRDFVRTERQSEIRAR